MQEIDKSLLRLGTDYIDLIKYIGSTIALR